MGENRWTTLGENAWPSMGENTWTSIVRKMTVILRGFREALKPGGVLYVTVVLAKAEWLTKAYERARAQGLPVVYGELADEVEEAYARTLEQSVEVAEEADESAYHYCPPLEQVRAWIKDAGLAIEEEGTGGWYEHFVVRKR